MTFTYDGYLGLLNLLKENGYAIGDYNDWKEYKRCAILRHDVDTDLQKALRMADLEYKRGIKSTYFVLLTSNFYNLYSLKNKKILKEIQDMGHAVGLHFDEAAYPEDAGNADKVKLDISKELGVMSEILDTKVVKFSYHRPSKVILDTNICLQGTVNVYGTQFFKRFKYLSDSRMQWREPVEEIIKSGKFSHMQILIHPFWYQEKETDIRGVIESFISNACAERYQNLDENMTALSNVVRREEVCRR